MLIFRKGNFDFDKDGFFFKDYIVKFRSKLFSIMIYFLIDGNRKFFFKFLDD